MNFGSVVMTVFPPADWGISSRARILSASSGIFGMTAVSMNRFTKVLFPVRTGPTTPTYTSPCVLSAISL